ncbi:MULTISPECIES: hypothetical protein [Methylomicrobium]|uniref:Uncharacterized protein n=1 Tax=Methylomicrobium album BG8 TaxID=686340 RepID=H8GQK7_METAL|nr:MULTISPECIES: hypothetical protein [Methylomicrobium]EIC29834.1 hypothetical protein Metal_2077 [Methylomicrobium album BG8]
MIDHLDKQTVDLFQTAKRGRGRPVTGQAMTNAERQKRYRQSLKIKTVTVTNNQDTDDTDWQSRAHAIQSELDTLRDYLTRLEGCVDRRNTIISDLRGEMALIKSQLSQLKGQLTKCRNENRLLRSKIQHLELQADVNKL